MCPRVYGAVRGDIREVRLHLYRVLLHGDRPRDVVQLVVEAARVADGLAVRVAAPQRRGRRLAVGARHAGPLRPHLRARAYILFAFAA